MCQACVGRMRPIHPPLCKRCGAPAPEEDDGKHAPSSCPKCSAVGGSLERTRSAVIYETPFRELIHLFKFRSSLKVRPLLVARFLEGAERHLASERFDGIVPVPLYWTRRFQREFNQAEVLAEPLSRQIGTPLLGQALRRVRQTLPQSRLSGRWRKENLEGAFAPGRQKVEGKRLLLVDDVMTTGATLAACADVLVSQGAVSVVGYTLARRLG